MSYGNFDSQITARGATAIKRSKETKVTFFEYKKELYQCTFKNQPAMTNDLSEGCEMDYCIKEYCQHIPR